MRLPSGTVDQYVYFYAVDATDFTTPETGLSGFTIYRSRDGGVSTAYTTPTVNETDATNMPGVYELLVDEDTTIGAGNDSEEMVLFISKTGMAPVVRTIEIYRPKITAGETLGVTSGAVDTCTTNTDMRGTDSAATAASLATVAGYLDTEIAAILADTNELQTDWANGGRLDLILDARASQASVDTIDGIVDAILVDTGTDIPATLTTVAGYIDTEVAAIKAKTDLIPAAPAAVGDIPTATQNADALLNRDMSAVSDTNARSPLNALRLLRNKYSISSGTMTVTKENDITQAWTATVTTDAAANPIIASDPA